MSPLEQAQAEARIMELEAQNRVLREQRDRELFAVINRELAADVRRAIAARTAA